MSSKPVLIARNAKEESEDESGKGIPWEDYVGMEVRMRKEPWRQLETDLGSAFDKAQGSQITTSPVGSPQDQDTQSTGVKPHTHPLSDIVCTYLTLTVVTAVRDDGANLVYKTRQIVIPVQTYGSESAWTTFAETVTDC